MPKITPETPGRISSTGEGFMVAGMPEPQAGRPPPSQQLWGSAGRDPSGATLGPGQSPPRVQKMPGNLVVSPPNLDPGPPEKGVGVTVVTDENGVWSDPTELGPTIQVSQIDPMYRTRGSDPPVESPTIEQVPYGDDPGEQDQVPSSAAPAPAPAVTPSPALRRCLRPSAART